MRTQTGVKNPINVLHIASGDLWAGAEVMTFNLLKELKKKQHLKITVVLFNKGVLLNKLREEQIQVYVYQEGEYSILRTIFNIWKTLRNKKIKVIHSHRYKENLIACILSKILRINIRVSTVHGLPEYAFDTGKQNNKISLILKINYWILRKCFTNVCAVSEQIAQQLGSRYKINKNKIETIHNGIPYKCKHDFNRKLKPDVYVIGSVGRLVPVKNYSLLIDIAKIVVSKRSDVIFKILGEGPLKAKLTKKAIECGIAEHIEFCPERANPEDFYDSVDVYINTSLHEGIPMSILESMCKGLPVIAPYIGGIPEIIIDGVDGILIKGYRPLEYADAIIRLIEDDQTEKIISNNAVETVLRRFTSEGMANNYYSIYEHNISWSGP